jgi:predicted DNA-binding transcriptional regulator AlpA
MTTGPAAAHEIDRRLGISATEAVTGFNRCTIWRWCKAGRFPQPTYIGNRRTWLSSEIAAWIASQAERPKPPPMTNRPGRSA